MTDSAKGHPNSGNTHRGTGVSVSFTGPVATELRRVAFNLNVKPAVLVRELVAKGLLSEYGISVK